MNLGWKLAATIRGDALAGLLDSYFSERHPVGAQAGLGRSFDRLSLECVRRSHGRAVGSLIGQKHTHQRAMDFDLAIVINKSQVAKLVHEVVHPRPRGPDHVRECFLADLGDNRSPAYLPCRNSPAAAAPAPAASRSS